MRVFTEAMLHQHTGNGAIGRGGTHIHGQILIRGVCVCVLSERSGSMAACPVDRSPILQRTIEQEAALVRPAVRAPQHTYSTYTLTHLGGFVLYYGTFHHPNFCKI